MTGIEVMEALAGNPHFTLDQLIEMFFTAWGEAAPSVVSDWIDTLPAERQIEAILALRKLAEQ